MKNAKSMPYPVWLVLLVLVCAMARCVGEYGQEQERNAHVDSVLESRTAMGLNQIPACGRGQSVMFNVGKDGLLVYWCGR